MNIHSVFQTAANPALPPLLNFQVAGLAFFPFRPLVSLSKEQRQTSLFLPVPGSIFPLSAASHPTRGPPRSSQFLLGKTHASHSSGGGMRDQRPCVGAIRWRHSSGTGTFGCFRMSKSSPRWGRSLRPLCRRGRRNDHLSVLPSRPVSLWRAVLEWTSRCLECGRGTAATALRWGCPQSCASSSRAGWGLTWGPAGGERASRVGLGACAPAHRWGDVSPPRSAQSPSDVLTRVGGARSVFVERTKAGAWPWRLMPTMSFKTNVRVKTTPSVSGSGSENRQRSTQTPPRFAILLWVLVFVCVFINPWLEYNFY